MPGPGDATSAHRRGHSVREGTHVLAPFLRMGTYVGVPRAPFAPTPHRPLRPRPEGVRPTVPLPHNDAALAVMDPLADLNGRVRPPPLMDPTRAPAPARQTGVSVPPTARRQRGGGLWTPPVFVPGESHAWTAWMSVEVAPQFRFADQARPRGDPDLLCSQIVCFSTKKKK